MPANKNKVANNAKPAEKSLIQEIIQGSMVVLVTDILKQGLNLAWPHVAQVIEQICKLENSSSSDSPNHEGENLVATFYALVSNLGLEAQKIRDMATSFGLGEEELGRLLGEFIADKLINSHRCSFDDVLRAAEAYGLATKFEHILPVKAEQKSRSGGKI